jgi:hypothetical protein
LDPFAVAPAVPAFFFFLGFRFFFFFSEQALGLLR